MVVNTIFQISGLGLTNILKINYYVTPEIALYDVVVQ
jgi:hypothetical protein